MEELFIQYEAAVYTRYFKNPKYVFVLQFRLIY